LKGKVIRIRGFLVRLEDKKQFETLAHMGIMNQGLMKYDDGLTRAEPVLYLANP
jgi:hypothetical protein